MTHPTSRVVRLLAFALLAVLPACRETVAPKRCLIYKSQSAFHPDTLRDCR
jgi:hypothetical protein